MSSVVKFCEVNRKSYKVTTRQLPVFIPEISSADRKEDLKWGEYDLSMSGEGGREGGRGRERGPAYLTSLRLSCYPALLPSLTSVTDSGI